MIYTLFSKYGFEVLFMKHPLIPVRSVKSAVAGSLLVMLPYLLLLPGREILGPLPAVYAVMLTVYLLPTALCIVTAVCGTAPMVLGLGTALSAIFGRRSQISQMRSAFSDMKS